MKLSSAMAQVHQAQIKRKHKLFVFVGSFSRFIQPNPILALGVSRLITPARHGEELRAGGDASHVPAAQPAGGTGHCPPQQHPARELCSTQAVALPNGPGMLPAPCSPSALCCQELAS